MPKEEIKQEELKEKQEVEEDTVRMPVMATVKDIKEIEEGVHSGEITDISVREVKFDANVVKYLDIVIQTMSKDGTDVDIRTSCPLNVSVKSDLGILLKALGEVLKPKEEIDLTKALIGKKVIFQTTNNDKGYADVLKETLRAKKE